MAISRQKEARSRNYALLSFRMTSRVLYSSQYHRQHRTLHAFGQFGALYRHNHDDKYLSRPGFEPGTPRLQAPVDTNELSGPAFRNDVACCVLVTPSHAIQHATNVGWKVLPNYSTPTVLIVKLYSPLTSTSHFSVLFCWKMIIYLSTTIIFTLVAG